MKTDVADRSHVEVCDATVLREEIMPETKNTIEKKQ
jgi:hypothetical protein